MAKLVKVCRLQDYKFERRQLPLVVDDTLTMVMQFNDSCCLGCEKGSIKQKEMESFVQKFSALTSDEVAIALMVTNRDIFHLLSQKVPCVGCRRSVERLFSQLVDSSHPALEPLVITSRSELSINRNYLLDPKALYALFHVHGSKYSTIVDSIPKSRKNKRCALHSLETHKVKCLGTWTDVWDVLSKECREKVVLIDADSLLDTLETYLRKHRFCSDCKSKVQRAYSILVGDVNSNSEKGYCPALYEGLRCCPQDRHLHIHCDTDFIEQIIHRAEPELLGSSSRRERHAKTLDIAQEEVLTCLGIHLYERLHRIWQKLRAEEQTWQILFCLGVESLKKNFEVALEKKQGKSNLELMCEELLAEEIAKEQKREQKRQKRKKKKNKGGPVENGWSPEQNSDTGGDKCECDENTNCSITNCANCDRDHSANNNTLDKIVDSCTDCKGDQDLRALGCKVPPGSLSNRSDAGYSSGHEGCESCSMPSSNGSDIACSEESCNHDGNSSPCTVDLPDVCQEWLGDGREGGCRHKGQVPCKSSRDLGKAVPVDPQQNDSSPSKDSHYKMTLTLQDMLEASCSSEDEGDTISEEDIQRFKANSKLLSTKRQELRETLRKRFDMMCRNGQCSHQNCKMNHAMKDLNLSSE